MLERLASLSLLVMVAACTGNVSLGQTPSASSAADGKDGGGGGGGGSTPTGPWNMTCTTYWREPGATDFAEQKFQARSDATVKQTIAYSGASIDFDLAPAPDAPANDALLTVKTPTQSGTQVYRVHRNERPIAQFAGDHGFTGLAYVGGTDLQYICVGEGATFPAPGASAVPLDVVCQVELRGTDGAVEKRDTVTYKSNDDAASPQSSQSIDYGSAAFVLSGYDDEYEGRYLTVDIARDPKNAPEGGGFRQLFQPLRNAPLLNQLAGTTFTGRVGVTLPSGKELSYACSSRAP